MLRFIFNMSKLVSNVLMKKVKHKYNWHRRLKRQISYQEHMIHWRNLCWSDSGSAWKWSERIRILVDFGDGSGNYIDMNWIPT